MSNLFYHLTDSQWKKIEFFSDKKKKRTSAAQSSYRLQRYIVASQKRSALARLAYLLW